MEIVGDIVGTIGVITILSAYILLQFKKLLFSSFTYSFLNLIGSLLILFSIFIDWNLPAATIEVAWAIVSLIGIYRWWKTKALFKKV